MISRVDPNPREPLSRVWTGLALLALVSAVAVGTWLAKPAGSVSAAPPEVAALEQVQKGFTWIAEQIKPSVVFIEVEKKAEEGAAAAEEDEEQPGLPDIPEPWRRFFGPDSPFGREFPFPSPSPRPSPRMPQTGQGSGVIIDAAGYILTNNHVVGDAAKVVVHLENGESYPAQVVGTDKLSDLAVIKIEPKRPLPAARLGNADQAKPGMWVMAAGYPFGGRGRTGYGGGSGVFDEPQRYEPTITVGVVSATDRQIESDIPGRPYRGLIQTDAPINPGNSGGPLVNIRGEVVGINQAIYTNAPFGGNIGVGFAIAVNARTKSIIAKLQAGEPVVRGQLGILIKPLTPALREVHGAAQGVFVDGVQPGSAADKGGVKAEDVILSYDGTEVTSPDQFVNMVQSTRPGTAVTIEVLRDGKRMSLRVTVEAYSPEAQQQRPAPQEKRRLGLTVEPLPQDQAKELGLPGGVVVRTADPLGDGARAGLRTGDVIVKINREAVTDLESYNRVLSRLKKGDAVVIRAWSRVGKSITTYEIDSLSE